MAYQCKAFLRGGQNGQIVLEVRDDSTGARNTDVGYVEINIAEALGEAIKIRETKGVNASGEPVYALVVRSASYAERKEDEEPDFQGGGGGQVQMYRLKSVQGDYITCRTWDGTTEGSTDIYIAKPMKLRNSITAATIDGVSVTYSYDTTVQRVATISSTEETQVVVPRYLVDDLIFAIAADHTSVDDPDEDEILLLDINADGRAWAKKYT